MNLVDQCLYNTLHEGLTVIKPINFILLVLIVLGFVIAIGFTAKVDLESVNLHRDVSVINQRLVNITTIEQKLASFSERLKADADKVINESKNEISKLLKEHQASVEQDKAKINSLESRFKALESRTSQIQQENVQLRNEIKQLQQAQQPR